MKRNIQIFLSTGWLIPAGLALLFFGCWIRDIVIPSLKGGNFDQLYDFHQVRYLDTTATCTLIAFVWAAVVVLQWARQQVKTQVKTQD